MKFLRGADHIIHAGDIGSPEVLQQLQEVAPITAVRGNNDRGRWARAIPDTVIVELGGVTIQVLHDLGELKRPGGRVVVTGHSHKPKVEERDGVLYVNPGSAGPRRFTLPVSAAELKVDKGAARARIKELL